MNKTELVLKHLKKSRTITSWQAIQLYKATRLADIIYRLRNRGEPIVSETVHNENAKFARYRLKY